MSNYACTGCPSSCSIIVEEINGEFEVSGNNCQKGVDLAIEEHKNPTTSFTGMVKVEGPQTRYLYVAGKDDVPKNKVDEIKAELSKMSVTLPVQRNDVIVENICNTGVDIIATRAMLF